MKAINLEYSVGQTHNEGLKKKTIMEWAVVKKKRRARNNINTGETCIMIELLKENDV